MTCSSSDWATAVQTTNILLRGHSLSTGNDDEPSLLVQRVAQNVVLCGAAAEHFSQDMPVWIPTTPEEDGLLPIDVLYGCYKRATRSIEIFVNRIAQDAKRFGAEPDELRDIVRIHEHAHAVVHLGSRVDDVSRVLSALGSDGKTDWQTFVRDRDSWSGNLSTETHEWLAQGLTYAALCNLRTPGRSDRLLKVFDALEVKQAPHYRVQPSVKERAATADWRLVLDVVRGDVPSPKQQDFTLVEGLAALVAST